MRLWSLFAASHVFLSDTLRHSTTPAGMLGLRHNSRHSDAKATPTTGKPFAGTPSCEVKPPLRLDGYAEILAASSGKILGWGMLIIYLLRRSAGLAESQATHVPQARLRMVCEQELPSNRFDFRIMSAMGILRQQSHSFRLADHPTISGQLPACS